MNFKSSLLKLLVLPKSATFIVVTAVFLSAPHIAQANSTALQCPPAMVCPPAMNFQSSLQCPPAMACPPAMNFQPSLQCPPAMVCPPVMPK